MVVVVATVAVSVKRSMGDATLDLMILTFFPSSFIAFFLASIHLVYYVSPFTSLPFSYHYSILMGVVLVDGWKGIFP